MLQLRSSIRDYIWTKVGDGKDTMVWFDNWNEICPLRSIVTPKIIANAGFNMNTKLADIFVQGEWRWPANWFTRFPVLLNVQDLEIYCTRKDQNPWRMRQGSLTDFSTSVSWDNLRRQQNEVLWANVVWFPQAVPKHAFLMWLIVQKKLKTQDIMSRWNSLGNANLNLLCCSLCVSGPDSHNNLFFECDYSAQVWNNAKVLAGMESIGNEWTDIFEYLVGIENYKSTNHVISKLVVSASVYFIWEERNRRLFTARKRSKTQLVEVIRGTIRMKLHTMRFKPSNQMERELQQWMLPRGVLVADDDSG
ncbi:putative reverse transcriptase zinc-binding domain-containing protein [Helianthus debilis subsp. tardiflorus]